MAVFTPFALLARGLEQEAVDLALSIADTLVSATVTPLLISLPEVIVTGGRAAVCDTAAPVGLGGVLRG